VRPTAPILVVTFLAGSIVGWAMARFGAQASGPRDERALSMAPAPESSLATDSRDGVESAFPMELWKLASRIASLESLIDDLESQRADVTALGKRAIDSMDDEELESALMSTVQLSQEEIGEIRDIRAFAGRMLEVAMQGVTEPDRDVPGTARVSFSESGSADGSAPHAGARFPAGTQRIYANFPTPDPERGQVLVKWFRTDRPRILRLQRYALRPDDLSAFVWLAPTGGWTPGSYQVDVYAADESATPLASGRYEIW